MYKEIEKKYKSKQSEIEFKKVYWISAIIITIIYNTINNIFSLNNKYFFIVYILLFLSVIIYYIVDFKTKMKGNSETIKQKISKYILNKNIASKKELIKTLRKYGFKAKNDIKLLIEYYSSRRSIKIESSPLSWIVSSAISIASFVEIAYNPSTNSIDDYKLMAVLSNSFGIIISLLLFFAIFNLLYKEIFTSPKDLQEKINEDLTEIYVNWNSYKNKL